MFATLPNKKCLPIFSSTSCNAALAESSLLKMALTRGVAGLRVTVEEAASCAVLRGVLLPVPQRGFAGLRSRVEEVAGCAALRGCLRAVPQQGVAGLRTKVEEAAGCAVLRSALRAVPHVSGGRVAVIRRPSECASAFFCACRESFNSITLATTRS